MFLLWAIIFIIGIVLIYQVIFRYVLPKLNNMKEVDSEELEKAKNQLESQINEAEITAKNKIKENLNTLKRVKEIKK